MARNSAVHDTQGLLHSQEKWQGKLTTKTKNVRRHYSLNRLRHTLLQCPSKIVSTTTSKGNLLALQVPQKVMHHTPLKPHSVQPLLQHSQISFLPTNPRIPFSIQLASSLSLRPRRSCNQSRSKLKSNWSWRRSRYSNRSLTGTWISSLTSN